MINLITKYFSIFTIFVTTSGFFIHNYFLSKNYGIVDFNILNSRMIYSGLSYTFILFAAIIGSIIFTDLTDSKPISNLKALFQWLVRGLAVANTFALFMDLVFDDIYAKISFKFLSIFVIFFWLSKLIIFSDGSKIRLSWLRVIQKFEIVCYELPIIVLSLWLLQYKDYRQVVMFFIWVAGFYYVNKIFFKTNVMSAGTERELCICTPSYFTNDPNQKDSPKSLQVLTMIVSVCFTLIASVCLYTNCVYPHLPQRYGGASTEELFITLRNGDRYVGKIINESEGIYYIKVSGKICLLRMDEIKELSKFNDSSERLNK